MSSDPVDPAALISSMQTCGMSLPEIARRTQLAPSTVYRLAAREITRPSYQTVARLIDVRDRVTRTAARPIVGMVRRRP